MASVQYNPFAAIFENRPATSVVIGRPGAGKTFFLLNVAANCLMLETGLIAIDPKDDLGVLEDVFPDKVEVIDINNIRPGALNPFRVLRNVDTNVITSIVSVICGGLSDQQTVAITPIINDFVIRYRRSSGGKLASFGDIADYLYANDNTDAQAVGTKLQIHRDSQYGGLLFEQDENELTNRDFGNGQAEGDLQLDLSQKGKIISLHGMDLPKSGGNAMLTEEQKFNSAIVYIICKMCREALTNGGYPTLFIMDEAHIAFQNPSFAQVVDEFMVLGRSLNVPTLLASQSVHHYPKTIAQMVSNCFCFGSSSDDAMEFLNMFYSKDADGMADYDSIIDSIQKFEVGQCFMIDSRKRSGIFKVTSLLGDGVTSNPLTKKRRKKSTPKES